MEGWSWGVLLKPAIGLVLVVAYYVVVYRGSKWLGRFIPEGRIKEALFRERGSDYAGRAADPSQHVLHDDTVRSRKRGE